MKAISLWQPWASLIANGAKKIETRSWPTNYRGPILIHAAKRKNKGEMIEICNQPWMLAALGTDWKNALEHLNNLPYGAIVALAELVDCKRVDKFVHADLIKRQRHHNGDPNTWCEYWLGNYEPGRFGWVLENVKALDTPIPYKGEQGLFEVPDTVLPQHDFSQSKEMSPL